MTNISVVNHIQMLNMSDKLANAFIKSGVPIEEFSEIIEIPVAIIEQSLCKSVTDDFTVNHMLKLSKYLGLKMRELF